MMVTRLSKWRNKYFDNTNYLTIFKNNNGISKDTIQTDLIPFPCALMDRY